MAALVLDAWAVMAWLKGQQPAAGYVRTLLHASGRRSRKPLMNIVNLGEVFYLAVKARDPAYGERVVESVRRRITIISASDELVMFAATLKSRHAISYADAFAAATAILANAPLVTGDPELQMMSRDEQKLKIEWIAS
jgi:predicted nucleic acid-binding protein